FGGFRTADAGRRAVDSRFRGGARGQARRGRGVQRHPFRHLHHGGFQLGGVDFFRFRVAHQSDFGREAGRFVVAGGRRRQGEQRLERDAFAPGQGQRAGERPRNRRFFEIFYRQPGREVTWAACRVGDEVATSQAVEDETRAYELQRRRDIDFEVVVVVAFVRPEAFLAPFDAAFDQGVRVILFFLENFFSRFPERVPFFGEGFFELAFGDRDRQFHRDAVQRRAGLRRRSGRFEVEDRTFQREVDMRSFYVDSCLLDADPRFVFAAFGTGRRR